MKIDLDKRKLSTSPGKDMMPEEKAFKDLLLSRLGEDDRDGLMSFDKKAI